MLSLCKIAFLVAEVPLNKSFFPLSGWCCNSQVSIHLQLWKLFFQYITGKWTVGGNPACVLLVHLGGHSQQCFPACILGSIFLEEIDKVSSWYCQQSRCHFTSESSLVTCADRNWLSCQKGRRFWRKEDSWDLWSTVVTKSERLFGVTKKLTETEIPA